MCEASLLQMVRIPGTRKGCKAKRVATSGGQGVKTHRSRNEKKEKRRRWQASRKVSASGIRWVPLSFFARSYDHPFGVGADGIHARSIEQRSRRGVTRDTDWSSQHRPNVLRDVTSRRGACTRCVVKALNWAGGPRVTAGRGPVVGDVYMLDITVITPPLVSR